MVPGRRSMRLVPAFLVPPLCVAAWPLAALGAPESPPGEPPSTEDEAEPSAAPPAPTEPSAPPSQAVTMPRLVAGERPLLPLGEAPDAFVDLVVIVDESGRVEDAKASEGSSAALTPLALSAVRTWTFEPATRDGQAVPAAVRVRVEFDLPEVTGPVPTARSVASSGAAPVGAAGDEPQPAPNQAEHDHSGPHEGDSHLEVTVHGNRAPRAEIRGPSDYFIHDEVLRAAPRLEGADVLRSVPGLVSVRTEGLAVAHSLSLRGFDAEHGQDLAISVGGLPINLPSHIHGQGYADFGFLIAESVDHLVVKEGVADPSQGDFAVAGSIGIGLGVDEAHRGLFVESGFGSFDTFRQKVLWAPREAHRESLGALELTTTGGFGENRGGQAASAILQHRFGTGAVTYRAIGLARAADAASAGVVRSDDVESGVLCFTCAYDTPSARAQGASTARLMGGFFADYEGPEHASGTLGFWGGVDDFRALSNWTGFTQVSEMLPGVSGRGDLFEQTNRTGSLGLLGRYRTQALELSSAIHGTLEAGVDGRLDLVGQSQSLIDASVRNQVWDRRVNADLRLMQLGTFVDLDFQLGRAVTIRGGLRAVALSYLIDDHLGNLPDPTRPQSDFLPGYRRTATGMALLPRTSLELRATENLSFSASYGRGYRSAQAALLEEGQQAPMALVDSADAGVRWRVGRRVDAKLTGHATFLGDEVTLDPVDQRFESIGPSTRLGGTLHVQATPWDWFVGGLSVTAVRATLSAPPPPTPAEPFPPYVPGQAVPGVPALSARLDLSVKQSLGAIAGKPVEVDAGTGVTIASERP